MTDGHLKGKKGYHPSQAFMFESKEILDTYFLHTVSSLLLHSVARVVPFVV